MVWVVLHWTVRVLFWVMVAITLVTVMRGGDDRRRARIRSADRIEFPPGWFGYCFWGVWITWLPLLIVNYSRHASDGVWAGVTLGAACVAGLLLFSEFPATIVVTEGGLEQVFWLRRNKRIQWGEIDGIVTGKKGRMITVTGIDGTRIVHTRGLADRARFLQEVGRHFLGRAAGASRQEM